MRDPSLVRFRREVAAAFDELERRRQEVNDLNVFPVPDGDTGDNMAMTLRAVLDEIDALGDESLDQIGRDKIVSAVARAALLGARGNSGVILSQIVRGAAEELVSRPGELVDPVLVAAAFLRDADVELAHQDVSEAARSLHSPDHESSRYRYCTNFAVTGDGIDGTSLVASLERIGDCVLVVGDAQTIRVHVHTDDPQLAVGLFEGTGEVSRLDVADMREQVAERDARLGFVVGDSDGGRCAVVAVATGEGIVGMYRTEGAIVVDPGPKMNPSTYELLAAIHSARSDEVVVLPNSPNVVMAAERACELAERTARVVATRSPQEGLAALVSFNPGAAASDNAESLWAAVSTLATGG